MTWYADKWTHSRFSFNRVISCDIYTACCRVLHCSASKEDSPPCLPEILGWGSLLGGQCYLRLLLLAPDDDDGVLAGSHVAQLLARLFCDDRRVLIVVGLLRQMIVIALSLLCLRLGCMKLLHQLAIRPGLRQRSQQK